VRGPAASQQVYQRRFEGMIVLRIHKRREALREGTQPRARSAQHAADLCVTSAGSQMKRRPSVHISSVHLVRRELVAALLAEKLRDAEQVATARGFMQRRALIAVSRCPTSATEQQRLHHVRLPVRAGHVERRLVEKWHWRSI